MLQQLSVSCSNCQSVGVSFADAVWCICTCPEATKLWKNVFFWKALVVFHSHVWTAVRIRNQRHPLDEIWTYVKSNHVICIRFSSVLELMAITEDQDRTCWPVDTVCYKYNSLLQVRKQENHIIPIIPCHPHPTPPHPTPPHPTPISHPATGDVSKQSHAMNERFSELSQVII